ncbi:hypothetical protein GNI_064300 [Gregarina niphandrodes]|uniref:Hyaluronan/mRNA-binding protein domain-containing protein n=1 Tax=Gregarina niphandrodes TaxID=110365 RepID=A0A023B800_GRENI|nr:hypothetical protein GNI_064300 [Gregarina niphandrodes]EZG68101.1 hypothetical protein GNI_064300 [Gregarina niphandrodes]|eukprot:XP_011130086.1 hypothetical protein GNI_064300 [Gregarina niphandrodes]
MPKYYTVATNNAFAALDEHEEADDLIINQTAEQLTKLNEEAAAEQPKPANRRTERNNEFGNRPPRRVPREGEEPRPPRRQESGDEPGADGRRERRPIRERKPRPEGRLDRQSGTGHGKEVKKGGAGAHNWGQAGDEVNTEADASPVAQKWGDEPTVPAGEGASPSGAPANTEDKASVLLYADFVAEQSKNQEILEEKQPAKKEKEIAAGMKVYTKKVTDVVEPKKNAETKTPEAKTVVNVNFRYPRQQQDNRRNDRIEQKEKTPKKAGPEKSNSEIKLDDTQAFPTLAH